MLVREKLNSWFSYQFCTQKKNNWTTYVQFSCSQGKWTELHSIHQITAYLMKVRIPTVLFSVLIYNKCYCLCPPNIWSPFKHMNIMQGFKWDGETSSWQRVGCKLINKTSWTYLVNLLLDAELAAKNYSTSSRTQLHVTTLSVRELPWVLLKEHPPAS